MGDRKNRFNKLIKTFLTNMRGKHIMSSVDIELKIASNLLKPLTKFEIIDSYDKTLIPPYSIGFVALPITSNADLAANGMLQYKTVFLRKGKNGKPRLDRGDVTVPMFDFFNNEKIIANHKFKIHCKELEISSKSLLYMEDADFLGWIVAMVMFLDNIIKSSELSESNFIIFDEIRNLPGRFYDDPTYVRDKYRQLDVRLSLVHTLRSIETRSMRAISRHYSRAYNHMIEFIEKLSNGYADKTLVEIFHINRELLQLTIEKLATDMDKLLGINKTSGIINSHVFISNPLVENQNGQSGWQDVVDDNSILINSNTTASGVISSSTYSYNIPNITTFGTLENNSDVEVVHQTNQEPIDQAEFTSPEEDYDQTQELRTYIKGGYLFPKKKPDLKIEARNMISSMGQRDSQKTRENNNNNNDTTKKWDSYAFFERPKRTSVSISKQKKNQTQTGVTENNAEYSFIEEEEDTIVREVDINYVQEKLDITPTNNHMNKIVDEVQRTIKEKKLSN